MIYTYECPKHGEFDVMATLADMQQTSECPVCRHESSKIIVGGSIQREDPTWIKDLNPIINETGKPFRTIKDLRQFYAQNPNIKPMESHPALSSSLGDLKRPDLVGERRERKKRAIEFLRKHRSLGSII